MLFKVLHQKLVLGRTAYQRGDIFECPEQEARMMSVIGVGQVVAGDLVATREPPQAPRGLSLKKGPAVSTIPLRARRLTNSQAKEQG